MRGMRSWRGRYRYTTYGGCVAWISEANEEVDEGHAEMERALPVSYSHLTLPTTSDV